MALLAPPSCTSNPCSEVHTGDGPGCKDQQFVLMASPTSLGMAVALFEQGFEEDRITEALRCCRTLEEAMAWLSSHGDSSGSAARDCRATSSRATASADAAATPGIKPPAAKATALAAGPARRLRARRKVADGASVAPTFVPAVSCAKGSLPSAVVGSPADSSIADIQAAPDWLSKGFRGSPQGSTIADGPVAKDLLSSAVSGSPAGSTVAGMSSSPELPPSSSACQEEASPQSAVPSDGTVTGLPIEPRDASEWWQAAAYRWREITASLKTEGKRPLSSDDSASTSALQKRQCVEDAVKDAADAVALAAVPTRRPPATPCSAEPPQQQLPDDPQAFIKAHLRSPLRPPGKVLTPCSSPRAMVINNQAEACSICCNDVPAWRAVRLVCGHGWYCAQCVLRHAEARLAVGAASVTCPVCCIPLAERDLRKLLPPELIDRLLARSLEQAISSAADLWACPTPNCPMRVALGDGELPRLKCSLCKKDSCLRCFAQPYHKGFTCEEHAERMREKGKKQQKDEDSLMQWIRETGTKQCPTCRMGVTKQNLNNQETQRSECHKMMCRNCNTRFCFKCLAVLTESYTCGCTINAHGFINPHTGKRLNHLRRGKSDARERTRR